MRSGRQSISELSKVKTENKQREPFVQSPKLGNSLWHVRNTNKVSVCKACEKMLVMVETTLIRAR